MYVDALVIDMDDGESEKKLKSNVSKSEEGASNKKLKSNAGRSEEGGAPPVKEPVAAVPEKSKLRKRWLIGNIII